MQIVPLSPIPSQILRAGLSNQQTTLTVYQKATGLFIDVAVSDAPIVTGTACLDRKYIIRNTYLGFIGDLAFIDMNGIANLALREDPTYTGLGSRFLLCYLTPADIAVFGAPI